MNTIGLKWTEYTPQVEGQITRDMLACQAELGKFVVYTETDEADRVLAAVGIEKALSGNLAELWILYKTELEGPQPPNRDVRYIERDLYVAVTDVALDLDAKPGYFLKEQGRIGTPRISQNPRPTHHGVTDPLITLLWG